MSSDCGILWAFHITIFFTFFFQVMETPEKVFIDDTMIQYLNSKLDLNLSCAKDFWNLNSMMTWCRN